MKYKFYETPLDIDYTDDDWPKDACKNTWTRFNKEINWIAKNLNKDVRKFRVDDMTFGDPVVFYGDQYMGYLMDDFYEAMDKDAWLDYWSYNTD